MAKSKETKNRPKWATCKPRRGRPIELDWIRWFNGNWHTLVYNEHYFDCYTYSWDWYNQPNWAKNNPRAAWYSMYSNVKNAAKRYGYKVTIARPQGDFTRMAIHACPKIH